MFLAMWWPQKEHGPHQMADLLPSRRKRFWLCSAFGYNLETSNSPSRSRYELALEEDGLITSEQLELRGTLWTLKKAQYMHQDTRKKLIEKKLVQNHQIRKCKEKDNRNITISPLHTGKQRESLKAYMPLHKKCRAIGLLSSDVNIMVFYPYSAASLTPPSPEAYLFGT